MISAICRLFTTFISIVLMLIVGLIAIWPATTGNGVFNNTTHAATSGKPLASLKGEKTLAAIEMKVLPVKDPILCGQSLIIVAQVKNVSANPVTVHHPDYGGPFTYELRSIQAPGILHNFSEKRFRSTLNPESQVPDPPQMMELAPDDVATYEIDLGELFTDMVLPGQYDLVAGYTLDGQTYTSPAVAVSISSPDVKRIAATISRQTETLTTVFGHKTDNGNTILMQRDSRPGHPGLGLIHPRVVLDPGVSASSLALALEPGEIYGGRWLAWIEREGIGAAWGWGKSLMGSIGPTPTLLKQPQLVETGLRLDGPHALFLVSGLKTDGRPVIKAYVFTYVSPPPAAKTDPDSEMQTLAPLAEDEDTQEIPEENPESLTFDFGSTLPDSIQARYIYNENHKEIQLVWTETIGDQTRILLRSLDPGNPEREREPRMLFEHSGKLAALALEPVGDGSSGVVDVLFGPDGPNRQMTYLRIPLTGGHTPEKWTFEARQMIPNLQKTDGQERTAEPEVVAWAISPVPAPEAPVLAKVEDQLVYTEAAGAKGWTVLASGAASAKHLRLFALYSPDRYKGRLWASWIDTNSGIQYQRVY